MGYTGDDVAHRPHPPRVRNSNPCHRSSRARNGARPDGPRRPSPPPRRVRCTTPIDAGVAHPSATGNSRRHASPRRPRSERRSRRTGAPSRRDPTWRARPPNPARTARRAGRRKPPGGDARPHSLGTAVSSGTTRCRGRGEGVRNVRLQQRADLGVDGRERRDRGRRPMHEDPEFRIRPPGRNRPVPGPPRTRLAACPCPHRRKFPPPTPSRRIGVAGADRTHASSRHAMLAGTADSFDGAPWPGY